MAGLPQGLPKTRAQPPRAAPPSTISNTSSTSSNATVVPHVTTPRARSLALPDVNSNSSNWPVQTEKGSEPASTYTNGNSRRHPHWDAPTMMAQDVTLLDENTVLEGLNWRLTQFLDIQPPYGLVTPEIVVACRADPNICGPAIDMLVSATLADGDPPVCELPYVRTDASGQQQASYTVPLTVKNSPEGLKKLLITWTGIVQQLRQLDPQFHTEIARNICDLDPLMNVLSPQVARIAADLKKIAEEVSLRRLFLSRFSELLMERLRETEGSTLNIGLSSGGSAGRLPVLGEVNEPDSSSNSSRSSSRSSRRSRPGSRHDRSRTRGGAPGVGAGAGDATGEPNHHPNGLRSQSSSSSLRLDPNGVPLEDGPDLTDPYLLSTARSKSSRPGTGGNSQPEGHPSPNQRPDIYGGILPLTIPAFDGNDSTSNFSPDQSFLPRQQHLDQPISSSKPSPKSEMLASLRMDPPSTSINPHQYANRMAASSPVPPRSYSPAGSSLAVEGSVSTRSRGPRPLPPRPSRSPKPEELFAQPHSSPAAPPPVAPSAQLNITFTVPDQGDPLNYQTMPFQIPSQDPGVFVVPSEIPSQAEVSSSSRLDLDAARERFAMESSSSIHSLEADYRGMKLGDSSNYGGRMRHGQPNMAMPSPRSSSSTSSVPHISYPATSSTSLYDMRNAGSADPLIPSWTSPETYRAVANSSQQFIPGANGSGGTWAPPSSWHEPSSGSSGASNSSAPKESGGGLFSGMKSWMSRPGSSKGASRSPESSYASPNAGGTVASSSQGPSRGYEVPPQRTSPRNDFVDERSRMNYTNTNGMVLGSTRPRQQVAGNINPVHNIPPVTMNGKPVSPGFAETYQVNPIAASMYHGGGPSGIRQPVPMQPPEHTYPQDHKPPLPFPPPASSNVNMTPEVEAIRQTMYSAIADSLASSGLRQVMQKDTQRAFFSAVSLANLNVSMNLQPGNGDTPNLVSMMGREIRLTDLPGAYRTCITELAAIGREARKLSEEDDERAIAYVARGKALPEPRIGRVRKLLERGVGFVGTDGRVRGAKETSGSGTGRSREFSNKISALSIEMMKLPAFQEEMLRKLVA